MKAILGWCKLGDRALRKGVPERSLESGCHQWQQIGWNRG